MRPTPTGLRYGGAWIALLLGLAPMAARAGETFFGAGQPLQSNIAIDTRDDLRPRLAADGKGHWVVVWYSGEDLDGTLGSDPDILTVRTADNGASWTAPAVLNSSATSDFVTDASPEIATDREGLWIVVWHSFHSFGGKIGFDGDIFVARSQDNGATWSPTRALNTNARSDIQLDENPVIATDEKGTWLTVWASFDPLRNTVGFDSDILIARSVDAGLSWSAPAPLNNNAFSDTAFDLEPQIATDGEGRWLAVWESGAGPGDFDILFAVSEDNGLTWSGPDALNTNAAEDEGEDRLPHLATNGRGVWICTWHSTETLGGRIERDYDILYSRSLDDGRTWSAPFELNPNADGDRAADFFPRIVTDGEGIWLTFWELLNDNVPRVVFNFSIDDGGKWIGRFELSGEGGGQIPQIVSDKAGNWVSVWESNDTLSGTIGRDRDLFFSRACFANAVRPGIWMSYR